MKKHLTARAVQSLKAEPGKKQTYFWDSSFKSGGAFGVCVYSTGRKAFVYQYSDQARQKHRIVLDTTDDMEFSEIRKMAVDLASRINNEGSPAEERRQKREAITFADLCDRYLEIKAGQNKPSTVHKYRLHLERCKEEWSGFKARDVSRGEVVDYLDTIAIKEDHRVHADRVKATLRALFNFALERKLIHENPAAKLRNYTPKRDRRPKRCLSYETEIVKFWESVEQEPPQIEILFKLLLLTGQRSHEVCSAKWSEFKRGIWTIPAPKTKNSNEHRIPIPKHIQDLLDRLKDENEDLKAQSRLEDKSRFDTYLFPTYTKRKDSEPHIKWIKKPCDRISKRVGPRFTPHDLRRTLKTWMAALRVDDQLSEKILNHISSENVVASVYNQYDPIKEMESAFVEVYEGIQRVLNGGSFKPQILKR